MATSFALRIDGAARQQGGNHSPQEDRESRRRQKLQALLTNLKAGDLDAARTAFTALVNFDPNASADPLLGKIGAALLSSNLYAAQHFGLELQNRGMQLPSKATTQQAAANIQSQQPWNVHSAIVRIDLKA